MNNYNVKVGIDSGKIKSYKDDVQRQLNEMSKDLVIKPNLDDKQINEQIASIRTHLEELAKVQIVKLSLDDETILQSVQNLSKNINSAFQNAFIDVGTKDIFSDMEQSIVAINKETEEFKNNAANMKEGWNAIIQMAIRGTKNNALFEDGLQSISKSLKAIQKAYSSFGDNNSFEDLAEQTNAITSSIKKVAKTISKNPLELRGVLEFSSEDIEQIESTIERVSENSIRAKFKLKIDHEFFKQEIENIGKLFEDNQLISLKVTDDTKTDLENLKQLLDDAADSRKKLKNINIGVKNKKVQSPSKSVNANGKPTPTQNSEDGNDANAIAIKMPAEILTILNNIDSKLIAVKENSNEKQDNPPPIEIKADFLNTVESLLQNIVDALQEGVNITPTSEDSGTSGESDSFDDSDDSDAPDDIYLEEKKRLENLYSVEYAKLKDNLEKLNNAIYELKAPKEIQNEAKTTADSFLKNDAYTESGFQQKLENDYKNKDFATSNKAMVELQEQNKAIEKQQKLLDGIVQFEKERVKYLKQAEQLLNQIQNSTSAQEDENFDVQNKVHDLASSVSDLQGLGTSLLENKYTMKIIDADDESNSVEQVMPVNTHSLGLMNQELQAARENIKTISTEFQPLREADKDLGAAAKSTNKLAQSSREVTKILNDYGRQLKQYPEIYQRILELQRQINANEISPDSAKMALSNIQKDIDKVGLTADSLLGKFKKVFKTRLNSALAGLGVNQLQKGLRAAYDDVVALDTAMTELKKVTNATDAEYIQFLDNASDRAKTVGASLVDTVSATADMARLGYNIEDASTLADAALIYQNVGDGVESVDEATSVLISTMQGFKIEATDVMDIVDKFNEVANNYASSAGDIGDIVMRSASAMASAGNNLDQTIALGVAANTVVQDADKVGTALRTMSARLRGSESELAELGQDTSDLASSTSALQKELLALTGVDVMADSDTFKSSYDILVAIGKQWDNLSDVSRSNVAQILFGKQQLNVGLSILEDAELAEEILKTSQESSGSAMKENEIYLDSIAGRIKELSAVVEEFSSTVLDSDLIKGTVSGLSNILELLTFLVDKVGLLKTTAAAAMAVWAKTNKVGKMCPLISST